MWDLDKSTDLQRRIGVIFFSTVFPAYMTLLEVSRGSAGDLALDFCGDQPDSCRFLRRSIASASWPSNLMPGSTTRWSTPPQCLSSSSHCRPPALQSLVSGHGAFPVLNVSLFSHNCHRGRRLLLHGVYKQLVPGSAILALGSVVERARGVCRCSRRRFFCIVTSGNSNRGVRSRQPRVDARGGRAPSV